MKPSQDTAEAVPTKQFFVSMLTRNISLNDAILDLIDNCLDGALRLADGADVDYGKHFVKIRLSKDQFSIEDNCGGIPRDVAIKYAFKMGRDADDTRDADTETIGMYGVGMKCALFKMGTDALVKTRHGNDTFEVHIDSEWLDDKEWSELSIKVPSNASEKLAKPGTTIVVKDLYPGVAKHFANAAFVNEGGDALGRGVVELDDGWHREGRLVEELLERRVDAPDGGHRPVEALSLVNLQLGLDAGQLADGATFSLATDADARMHEAEALEEWAAEADIVVLLEPELRGEAHQQ